jgi:nitrile hydratase
MSYDKKENHSLPSDLALRVKALESVLIDKGLINPETLDALIDTYEHKIGPKNGAQVVARAWVDENFKAAIKNDCSSIIKKTFGFAGRQGEHIIAVENTPKLHNVVVCTLCSCYPWTVLGLPPTWYKSAPYRARVVEDPRSVLNEFGTNVPIEKEIRVWDSTSEMRYLVIPERPSGTEEWSEDKLATLVTRDSMIGVSYAKEPN